MSVSTPSPAPPSATFRHEALLYAGEADFLAGTLPFIRDGVASNEPVLVAVPAAKINLLRASLGFEAESVRWVDMAGIGGNPARIIPLWREFVARHGARSRLRGIGEPIWPQRTRAEIAEGQRHEALLNLAFAETPGLSILCPYDSRGLDQSVLDAAHANHPLIRQGAAELESTDYRPMTTDFDAPLDPPPEGATETTLDGLSPLVVRSLVSGSAERAGLGESRADDLVFAVTAVAAGVAQGTNGLSLLAWEEGSAAVCEVRSPARIRDPLVGRGWPPTGHGRYLWAAHQLADLVELRSSSTGTVVRLRMAARVDSTV